MSALIGRWTSAKNDRVFLEFQDGGVLIGSDGANRIQTTWTSDGPGAEVAPSMMTLRAAPGMETWVAAARRVEAEGEELTLYGRDGDRLGVLHRTPSGG